VDFENNNFQGTAIPTEFGTMRNLDTLSLFGCQLSGKIPVEFELLVTLTLLDLRQNQLSGPLPTGLYLLSNSLAELAVRDNLLTGGIPSEYGLLTNLQVLDLGDTGIWGRIPSELGLLGGMLAFLYLDGNLLTGALPSELGTLDRLWSLWLHNNTAITGTVPAEWTSMVSLQELLLEGTSVTGDLDFIACNSNLTETTAECGASNLVICNCCTKCTGDF
jgi:Leucine-rich repeat (LRR) protein